MKIQKKKEEHLHYTTLKERKPSLIQNLLPFQVSAGVYIGERRIWKARRSHASKINAWAHHLVAKTRLLPHFHGNTRDLGPWFWYVGLWRSGYLLDLLRISYFHLDLRQTPARV